MLGAVTLFGKLFGMLETVVNELSYSDLSASLATAFFDLPGMDASLKMTSWIRGHPERNGLDKALIKCNIVLSKDRFTAGCLLPYLANKLKKGTDNIDFLRVICALSKKLLIFLIH